MDIPEHLSSAARRKLNEMFVVWVCLPSTQKLLTDIVSAVKQGKPLPARLPASPLTRSPKTPASPPRSPLSPTYAKGDSTALSPLGSPTRKAEPLTSFSTSPISLGPTPEPSPEAEEPPIDTSNIVIPLPGVSIYTNTESELSLLRSVFHSSTISSTSPSWLEVVRFLDLPSFSAQYLAYRIHNPTTEAPSLLSDFNYQPESYTISWNSLESFYTSRLAGRESSDRLFNILSPQVDDGTINMTQLLPLLQHYVHNHSGLAFLKDTPEFQASYAETIALRVLYIADTLALGRVNRLAFRRSKFFNSCMEVDAMTDVNLELNYFSYEHFYVLYCKFWELDTDQNKILDREDLLRYGNYALGTRAIDRILAGAPRKLTSTVPNTMNFQDFVAFCISEEDKTTETSLIYWLRVCDLDGDGILSLFEMEFFYEEQIQRIINTGQESVTYEDLICQIFDIMKPKNYSQLTLADLKRASCKGAIFNYLLNIQKFFLYEQRDPFEVNDPEALESTDWARFAKLEYDKLASDTEGVSDWGNVSF
ncbi:hypothetical protein P9112_009825 [Eukaryota sp. TZLM1-RC]